MPEASVMMRGYQLKSFNHPWTKVTWSMEPKLSSTISFSLAAWCVSHACLKYLGHTSAASALFPHDLLHKESEASNAAVAKQLTWHHTGTDRHTHTHTHVLPLHSITVFTQWANTDTLTCTPLQCSQLRVNRYLTQPVACDRVQPTVPHTQCSVISLAMASLSKSEEHVGESQRQPPFTPLAHVAFCNETPQPWQLASMMSLPALRYRPLTGIGSALWNHLGFVPFHKLWQRVSFSRRP